MPTPERDDEARSARGGAAPRDHYFLLGIGFSLATDSVAVREFFRSCYRAFRVQESRGPALALEAWLGPEAGTPRAVAGGRSLDLTGRAMPENLAFLFLLNTLMDQVGDYLVLHGAAVSVEGRGVVLAGPPTAGKSTLVMELARRGAAFLSDDVAPVDRRTGRLHAFPRAVGIRRDSQVTSPIDVEALGPDRAHRLPHKWLVQPEALGFRLAGPSDAPCPIDAVILLDPSMTDDRAGERPAVSRWEIALSEPAPSILTALGAIPGVGDLREEPVDDFPRYSFEIRRGENAMQPVADLCRRHPDRILYLDESRAEFGARPADPLLREEPFTSLLMPLARDLLNRSETGALLRDCGGLPGLLREMARVLSGTATYRLRSGETGRTADLVLSLLKGSRETRNAGQAPTGGR